MRQFSTSLLTLSLHQPTTLKVPHRIQTDNEIGREGGKALLDAMRGNNTLRNFQFGGQSQVAESTPLSTSTPAVPIPTVL